MKKEILDLIDRRFNKKNHDPEYPQTWYFVPHNPYWRMFFKFICGVFGGHELSDTEWGYGGGDFADRWCRWCNCRVKVSKESIRFKFPDSSHLLKEIC